MYLNIFSCVSGCEYVFNNNNLVLLFKYFHKIFGIIKCFIKSFSAAVERLSYHHCSDLSPERCHLVDKTSQQPMFLHCKIVYL